MALACIMQCDLKNCTNAVKEGEDITCWWAVHYTLGDTIYESRITVYHMIEGDFKSDQGEYYCCMAHAQQAIAAEMSIMQERKIKKQRDSVATDAYEPLAQK